MARARRAESDLCLAIVDIDHFKAYNDANGHLAGDAVLRECAVAWDAELRGADTIVRFGGEEFLVVLPDCPLEQAAEIVERLRAATPGGQTCSAGLACWDCAESADDLVDRADSALYRAKAAGRDRLVQAPRIGVMMAGMGNHELTVRFRRARRDPELTVIEGFHALKHALRFGAELVEAVAVDPEALEALARGAGARPGRAAWPAGGDDRRRRPWPSWCRWCRAPAWSRSPAGPPVDLAAVLADPRPAPVVLLEQPRNMGNIGACVRVAAAADAAAVLTTGENDPWYPDAVRGAAGLHFALPVTAIEALPASDRPLLAIDPEGEELRPGALPPRAVLAFGTERHGISAELLERADARVAIPMRAGRLQPQPRHLGRGPLRMRLAACRPERIHDAGGRHSVTNSNAHVPLTDRKEAPCCRSQISALGNFSSSPSRSSSS